MTNRKEELKVNTSFGDMEGHKNDTLQATYDIGGGLQLEW